MTTEQKKKSVINRLKTMYPLRALVDGMYERAVEASKEGKPVAWNETHWVDPEFDKLYRQASGTYDVEERRKIMCKLQTIQMERGSIGIPFWQNFWSMHAKKYRDVPPSPGDYWLLHESWLQA